MKLCVVSHKLCWPAGDSFVTNGGFPFQMEAISKLFDSTTLVVPVARAAPPREARPLVGRRLTVHALDPIPGMDLRAKLAFLLWLPRNFRRVWSSIAAADAVHVPVPGDVGTFGILLALWQRKRLFVRHCGTWGHKATMVERFLIWLLEKIAGGRNVVLATGGGSGQPSAKNPAIEWIFSTSISAEEMSALGGTTPWVKGEPLRLITVSRLTVPKNTRAAIEALALVRARYKDATLDVVGDGECLEPLRTLALDLGVGDAVTFHGGVPHEEVISLLQRSHLFVLPTRVAEGFPKAVLEALACGLGVVATAVSVVPQLIGDDNGIALQDTDGPAVARAILTLIEGDDFAGVAVTARRAAAAYTLEAWGELIGTKLQAVWGPLATGASTTSAPAVSHQVGA